MDIRSFFQNASLAFPGWEQPLWMSPTPYQNLCIGQENPKGKGKGKRPDMEKALAILAELNWCSVAFSVKFSWTLWTRIFEIIQDLSLFLVLSFLCFRWIMLGLNLLPNHAFPILFLNDSGLCISLRKITGCSAMSISDWVKALGMCRKALKIGMSIRSMECRAEKWPHPSAKRPESTVLRTRLCLH